MKRFAHYLMAALAIIISSCGDSSKEVTVTPSEGKDFITFDEGTDITPTFDAEGGSVTISFVASSGWTASLANGRADSWCSVSPKSGEAGSGSFTIRVSANEEPDEKSAVVQLKSGTVTKNIQVSQKQLNTLLVTADSYELTDAGGTFDVEVKANVNYTYSIDDDASEWISCIATRALNTSYLTFQVAPNEEESARMGIITLTDGTLTEEVAVYQTGTEPAIIISQREYILSADGGDITVEVSANVDVEVEMPDEDWIYENETRAYSTHTYHFTVDANEEYDNRSAEIIFRNEDSGLEEVVVVHQMQLDAIVLAMDLYEVDAAASQLIFDIEANVDFEVFTEGDWITYSPTRGLTTHELCFDIAENTSEEEREGTIIITSGDIRQEVKVVQAGKGDVEITAELIENNLNCVQDYLNSYNFADDYPFMYDDTFTMDFKEWLANQKHVINAYFDDDFISRTFYMEYPNDVKSGVIILNIDNTDDDADSTRSIFEDFAVYYVPSMKDENIIPKNKLNVLCYGAVDLLHGLDDSKYLREAYLHSPVNFESIVTLDKGATNAVEMLEHFQDFGIVLITKTHGFSDLPGLFVMSLNKPNYDYIFSKSSGMNFLRWDVYKKWFDEKIALISKGMVVQSNYILNNVKMSSQSILFASYCYSAAAGNVWSKLNGDFNYIGCPIFSFSWENKGNVSDYFDQLFNGHTHNESYQYAYENNKIDHNLWTNNRYPNLRYFSISTEEVNSESEGNVIKGKINGYENLKNTVTYKVYYSKEKFDSPITTLSNEIENISVTPDSYGNIETVIKDLLPDTKYYYCIGMEYEDKIYFGEVKSFMMNICPDGNHPHMINLGLPSGTKWACCNVGATSPNEYGDYYAWGETEPKNKYTKDNYKYYLGFLENEDHTQRLDSCKDIGTNISGTQYDVAHVKWGGKWCMPTIDEIEELMECCDFKYIEYNGVGGDIIIGSNGNRIFLPFAGYYLNELHYEDLYWSSTVKSNVSWYAYGLELMNRFSYRRSIGRVGGLPVRPVCK